MTKRTQAILGLSGVFLLGALCGALLFGVFMRDRARETVGLRNRDGFIHHFEQRLNLSDAQRDSLKDELDGTYRQMAELREETSRRYNALIDTLAVRIMPTLTKEQQELFREQESKFRRFLPKEKRWPGRARPGSGPGDDADRPGPDAALHPSGTGNVPLSSQTRDDQPARDQRSQGGGTDHSPADSAAARNWEDGRMASPLMGRGMERAAQRLKLTPEQSASLAAIVAKGRARIKEIRMVQESRAETKGARRTQIAAVMQEMDKEIGNLLNQDQREEWARMRKEMEERMQKNRGQRAPAPDAGGR